jgi:hypothetical protein
MSRSGWAESLSIAMNRLGLETSAPGCHSEPFAVIPSEARNLALPVQGKLREESRTSPVSRARFLSRDCGIGMTRT